MIRIRIIICCVVLFICSCSSVCKTDGNIYVSELILNHCSNRNIDYCGLLKGTLKREKESYYQFLRLEIFDGAGYDHGITLCELVEYLGEDSFVKMLKGLSSKEKQALRNYIIIGLESDNKRKQKEISLVFPVLSKLLN